MRTRFVASTNLWSLNSCREKCIYMLFLCFVHWKLIFYVRLCDENAKLNRELPPQLKERNILKIFNEQNIARHISNAFCIHFPSQMWAWRPVNLPSQTTITRSEVAVQLSHNRKIHDFQAFSVTFGICSAGLYAFNCWNLFWPTQDSVWWAFTPFNTSKEPLFSPVWHIFRNLSFQFPVVHQLVSAIIV
jgi:hypothetical protein